MSCYSSFSFAEPFIRSAWENWNQHLSWMESYLAQEAEEVRTEARKEMSLSSVKHWGIWHQVAKRYDGDINVITASSWSFCHFSGSTDRSPFISIESVISNQSHWAAASTNHQHNTQHSCQASATSGHASVLFSCSFDKYQPLNFSLGKL